MKLPDEAHTSYPWLIHALAPDFELEDVWALPTPGGPDDFPLLVERLAGADPATQSPSRIARVLWAVRWKLGEIFGWDDEDTGIGSRVGTLRDRLPADLRDRPSGPKFDAVPFTALYLTENEWAAEVANKTVHGVMHLAWVAEGQGSYQGRMAVYVKPRGRLGRAYMALIKPFRLWLVYPALMRQMEREWLRRRAVTRPCGP